MSTNHTWKSKWLFILAAIGAAAGLGNLWRFPYMVFENGGAAFIIAYIICLAVLVIPLVTLEVSYGQAMRANVVDAFGKQAGWFGRFIAWMLILMLFGVIGYYSAVVAWGVDFLAHSPWLSWGNDAESFFMGSVLKITDSPEIFGGFSIPIVIGLIVTYVAVYFSIFRGIESISHVIKWTVPMPFFLLGILFINAFFLPGSADGFRYLLVPDWSHLLSITMWKDAASQAFLSANVGLVMTFFYASFNEEKSDITQSAFLICIGDTVVSLIGAFAIFGTLGYMAAEQGVAIQDVVASGPTLAFIAFPNALSALPFGNAFFAVLFFVTVFTLAIDTVFAVAEVVADTFQKQFAVLRTQKHEWVLAGICTAFFLWSLAFAGGNGLYRLDAIDHAIWSHLLFWAVIPEIILIGWLTPVDALRTRINAVSAFRFGRAFNVIIKFVAPATLVFFYVSVLPAELAEPYGGYDMAFLWQWMIVPLACFVIGAALFASRTRKGV